MTELPAAGDVVETKINCKWSRCVVVGVIDQWVTGRGWRKQLVLKREGPPKGKPRMYRNVGQVRPQPQSAVITGNIFADFLDDQGEPAAAEKLRRAFPMG